MHLEGVLQFRYTYKLPLLKVQCIVEEKEHKRATLSEGHRNIETWRKDKRTAHETKTSKAPFALNYIHARCRLPFITRDEAKTRATPQRIPMQTSMLKLVIGY